ncbi:hypothetical protein [Oscillatoria sp. FACHB-1406]|uniref:hypothetical protein n=1 Tax=Oscillatoria sp. FACHB-1406 TaxID=2692846 RepID=UPI0018F034AF|nr:hypothetical protein [Oscillatoria sp. FACHB-1406]
MLLERKFVFWGVAIAAMILLALPAISQINPNRCSFKGADLYGKVQVVQAFPDVKVQVVPSAPDLKVKFVENFPNECGEWQIVDIFPDLKVQFVNLFPDLKIQLVGSSPGIP